MAEVTTTTAHTPVHALAVHETLSRCGTDTDQGLSSPQAEARLQEHGPNALPAADRDSAVRRFLRHLNDVLIYVLLGAAALTAALQHWVDTAVILAVVVVNATVGFLQEGRAERALEGIREMLSPEAQVLRDGRWQTVPADELVPGDTVRLRAGDKIPADLRLTEAHELAVEESALTGESVPALKSTDPVDAQAPLGDRTCMAFSGTMVTAGSGRGVVVATGAGTELGQINTMMSEVESLQTPLTRQIAAFGRWLALAVLALTAALVLVGFLLHGTEPGELLLAAASFAVAAIPEGLPALITITLALGVQTMARRSAITRRLPAVQTLGSVTVICSDKTGTLTKNEMTVARAVVGRQELTVTGTGYAPEGEVLSSTGEPLNPDHPGLRRLAAAMSIANDTELVQRHGRWSISGEPTEGALQAFAAKAGYDPAQAERLTTLPFSSENKLMATVAELDGEHGTRERRVLVKGAPDRLLERSSMPESQRQYWEDQIHELSAQGLRVLAAAERPAQAPDTAALTVDSLGTDLSFLGVVGIVDPPREEAVAAIEACHTAGISVKMITGDHIGTARAIAAQMGLDQGAGAVSGAQLEAADDDELRRLATSHHVFARTSPEHKLRLVRALQAEGEVVAMTGDGVNDAPALRRADVGVAMGVKGTEVTKEAAEIVLADDNFTTIEVAVEEGRRIYDNLRKAIVFLLPTNGAQSAVVLFAVALGWTLPLTPLQVLWVNMVTAVTLAFAFAFEPAEPGVMKRPPRDPSRGLVELRHTLQIAVVSLLIAAVTIGVFDWRMAAGDSLESARTVATTVLVVCQAFYLFNVKALQGTSLRPTVLLNNRAAWVCVAGLTAFQLLFIYAAPLQAVFDSQPLPLQHVGLVTLVGLAVFLVIEVLKLLLAQLPEPRRARRSASV
ncbi:HAD-IC family P-type ATPase [Nesterenkonia massiliensis]|uniref:HAD-IC family P-type ATPase n=1 Tax=Nesterenkonia massiliensis TaxID=1232429 RepID=A0ABT2HSP7_9MICC|nr:HAD-IC family P-type ATPase [Nesterenkonia massiliensis]MCT1607718.1 HAD-IC family P-type ATPase [Nesterenkonia massiliensis]